MTVFPPLDITLRTTSGGHLGLFMSHEALAEHWPPLLADVLTRSKLRRRAPQRAVQP